MNENLSVWYLCSDFMAFKYCSTWRSWVFSVSWSLNVSGAVWVECGSDCSPRDQGGRWYTSSCCRMPSCISPLGIATTGWTSPLLPSCCGLLWWRKLIPRSLASFLNWLLFKLTPCVATYHLWLRLVKDRLTCFYDVCHLLTFSRVAPTPSWWGHQSYKVRSEHCCWWWQGFGHPSKSIWHNSQGLLWGDGKVGGKGLGVRSPCAWEDGTCVLR